MEYTSPWMNPPIPEGGLRVPKTYEQRILAAQEDSYKVLCDIRLHLMNIEAELRKPRLAQEESGARLSKPHRIKR